MSTLRSIPVSDEKKTTLGIPGFDLEPVCLIHQTSYIPHGRLSQIRLPLRRTFGPWLEYYTV